MSNGAQHTAGGDRAEPLRPSGAPLGGARAGGELDEVRRPLLPFWRPL
jgi:hypothetical protein